MDNRDDNTLAQLDHAESMEYKFNKLLAGLPELSSHIKKEDLIKKIIEHAKEMVNADHVHVRVIDWLNKKLVLEEYAGEKDIGLKHPLFSSIKVNEAIGGRVFHSKKSEKIPNVQKDKKGDFQKYLNNIREHLKKSTDNGDRVKLKKLTSFLERFGPVIAIPLLLQSKPIGVLTAIRQRKPEDTEFPLPFTDNDLIVLEHFANQASVAIRNAWLFEAATWQPSESDVETLCHEVVREAMKRTGAMDGRVRFVNWEKKYLVPGALVWSHENGKPNTDPERRDPRVSIRKIGECGEDMEPGTCEVSKVAMEPYKPINVELKNDPDFKSFMDFVEGSITLYKEQLKALKYLQTYMEKKKINLLKINLHNLEIFKFLSPKAKKELDKRLSMLQELLNDEKKFAGSVRKHKDAVENLAGAWKEYKKYLKKWNYEVAVPILIGDKLIGVLNAHSDKEKFTNSDEAILQAIANRVATSIIVHQQKVLNRIHKIEQRMTADRSFEGVASMVAEGIGEVAFFAGPEKTSYLFSWDKIPGDDNGKLIKYLKQKFSIEGIKPEKIEKTDGGRTIRVPTEKNYLSLRVNDEKTKVNLKIDDIVDAFDAKMENGKLNIYIPTIFPLLYICRDPMLLQDIVNGRNFGKKFYPQKRQSASKDEKDLLGVPIRDNGLGFEAIKQLADKPEESVFIVRENIDDPVVGGSESAQEKGVITTACLPLAFGGIVYGLLYIHIRRRYFFTELEKDIVTLFAAHAAIVLKNLGPRKERYEEFCGEKLINDSIKIREKLEELTLESGK